MAGETTDPEAAIRALPLWRGALSIEPLLGGITNKNYLVTDAERRAVVRFGGDIPEHGVLRFNEHAASRAAAAADVSPRVLFAGPALLVLDYIRGRTYCAEDVRANRARCVALAKRAHRDIPNHIRGPTLAFNAFHIIRDYGHTLADDRHRSLPDLPRLLAIAQELEQKLGPIDLVFGHNDLLAANFIDDGERLWLVDWDYAGWNTPLFDLGGLASNNGFDAAERDAMLQDYFGLVPDDDLRLRLQAVLCASLLREALWSMVSETRSTIDFDYKAYTQENLARFDAALETLQEMR
jgi:thiamine kinase-like enzyme